MPDDEKARAYPMVDGAAINPYDLPGEPRPDDDPDKYTRPPTAEESAPVPGPGDPDVDLVEVGDGAALPEPPADDTAEDDDKPKRRRG